MTIFEFPFKFQDVDYTAGCHLIPPPPDTQYHITPRDEKLKAEHGYPIIFHSKQPLHISYPLTTPADHPDGGMLVQSLINSLTEFLQVNPQYQ